MIKYEIFWYYQSDKFEEVWEQSSLAFNMGKQIKII